MTASARQPAATGPGKLELRPARSLSQGLSTAMADILAHACSRAEIVMTDPVKAVHEYRKSIRRGRAMLRLLEGLMSEVNYRELAAVLRDAHRRTSQLRDRDVVLDTLEALPLAEEDSGIRETLRRSITSSPPNPSESIALVLRGGADNLAPVPARVARALPSRVKWRDLQDALARSYRRAWARMRKADGDPSDEAVHEWRKRIKELNYQLELFVGRVEGSKANKVRRRMAGLAERLGQVVDQMVLRDFMRQHVPPEHRERALEAVVGHQAELLELALKRGRRIFKKKPAEFAGPIIEFSRKRYRQGSRGL